MPKATLSIILDEVKKLGVRMEKAEAKNDSRFEIVKEEFQSVRAEIGAVEEKLTSKITAVERKLNNRISAVEQKLTSKITAVERKLNTRVTAVEQGLKSEMTLRFAEVNHRFNQVDRSLSLIAEQTATHVEEIKSLDSRVSKLEGRAAS